MIQVYNKVCSLKKFPARLRNPSKLLSEKDPTQSVFVLFTTPKQNQTEFYLSP